MSKDTDRLMGHADEADGIEEYDNPLPDWWLGLFWLCILWAIGYTVHYHFIAGRSQAAEFQAEMAAAAVRWPAQDAADVEFALTPEAIADGETVYKTYCFVCHGAALEGGIGPTFLDDEWLHGHTPEEVMHTITNGVTEKGMAAWGPILSAQQIKMGRLRAVQERRDVGYPSRSDHKRPPGALVTNPGKRRKVVVKRR